MTTVRFIRLGKHGNWAGECIENGWIKIRFVDVPHQLCIDGKWDEVERTLQAQRKKDGMKERDQKIQSKMDITELRDFYELPESTIWLTTYNDCLWKCNAEEKIELNSDNTKTRLVKSHWTKVTSVENVPIYVKKTNVWHRTIWKLPSPALAEVQACLQTGAAQL